MRDKILLVLLLSVFYFSKAVDSIERSRDTTTQLSRKERRAIHDIHVNNGGTTPHDVSGEWMVGIHDDIRHDTSVVGGRKYDEKMVTSSGDDFECTDDILSLNDPSPWMFARTSRRSSVRRNRRHGYRYRSRRIYRNRRGLSF